METHVVTPANQDLTKKEHGGNAFFKPAPYQFQVYKDKAGEWRARFVSMVPYPRTMWVTSESYHNAQECKDAIQVLRDHAPGADLVIQYSKS